MSQHVIGQQHADLVAPQRAIPADAHPESRHRADPRRDRSRSPHRAPPALPPRAKGRARRALQGSGTRRSGSRDRDRPARARCASAGTRPSSTHRPLGRAPPRASPCTRPTRRAPCTSESPTSARWNASITSSPSRVTRESSSAAIGTSANAPTASIAAEIAVSTGGTISAPSPRYTLYPLSVGGLCDAVTITRGATEVTHRERQQRRRQAAAATRTRRIPAPANTAALSSANTSLLCHASHPMTTPAPAAPGTSSSKYAANPAAARRTDDAVHPVRSGAERAPEPRRAELQPAR